MAIDLPDGALRARFDGPPLPSSVLFDLAQLGVPTLTEERDRFEHSRDWWPLTIGWTTTNEVPSLAGAVVSPRSVEEVAAVLAIANRHRVAVTPQGGRSGVVGGAVPNTGAIALDRRRSTACSTWTARA